MMKPNRHERVEALFWEARALPPSERGAFLMHQCGGDDQLIEEVTSLLRADESAGILDRTVSLPELSALIADDDSVPAQVGPYRVTQRIGRGGMGVLFRAYDPRLGRDVALKFLAAGFLPDRAAQARLIAEARAASALDHPHICTIYDIGMSDDRLYVAMAYYGRPTLAQRLEGRPLEPAEAVEIALQVADGLEAAHAAGIVHRDIKPANIAFGDRGEAKILDFGIALLSRDAAGGTAQAAGTPLYTAPEQLRGTVVDKRADIWSLGVVLYEMLTGRNPFAAGNTAAAHAAILESNVPDVRSVQPKVPAAVAHVVARALRKDPAERFASAAEFADALRSAIADPAARRRRRTWQVAAFAAVLALGTGFIAVRRQLQTPVVMDSSLDASAVAVLPFRVSGDNSLAYLREGMVDLLSAKLTGEGGLRAADSRNVLAAWLQAAGPEGRDLPTARAIALARKVGVANVMLGDVVATPATLVINAAIVDRSGVVVARASAEGPRAGLSTLVDRVVAQLLTTSAGEDQQRLDALTSTSLPALRAYLDGQAAWRRGLHQDAVRHFGRALDIDSTFALAGIGVELAGSWVGGSTDDRERGLRIAWQHRDRLSVRDRALLLALTGPDYPKTPTARQQLDAVEDALRFWPDRADLWYLLGDQYFHFGRILTGEDWSNRALGALERATQLDANLAGAVQHIVTLHGARGDAAALRAAASAAITRGQESSSQDYLRWRAARAGDSRAAPPLDSLDDATLGWVAMIAQDDGIAVAEGLRAAQLLAARPGTREDQLERRLGLYSYALNRGRPQEAATLADWLVDVQPDPLFHHRLAILTELYGDGDARAAERGAATLASRLQGGTATPLDACVLALWRLSRPNAAATGNAERAPASGRTASPAERLALETCTYVRQALEARADSGAAAALGRLDAFVRNGHMTVPLGSGDAEYAHIALARLNEARGDGAAALSALRARVYFLGWQRYLAAALREESRIAAQLGDAAGARRALDHYLALRLDPEPSLRGEVERATAAAR